MTETSRFAIGDELIAIEDIRHYRELGERGDTVIVTGAMVTGSGYAVVWADTLANGVPESCFEKLSVATVRPIIEELRARAAGSAQIADDAILELAAAQRQVRLLQHQLSILERSPR